VFLVIDFELNLIQDISIRMSVDIDERKELRLGDFGVENPSELGLFALSAPKFQAHQSSH
jgi:hypothetical protein